MSWDGPYSAIRVKGTDGAWRDDLCSPTNQTASSIVWVSGIGFGGLPHLRMFGIGTSHVEAAVTYTERGRRRRGDVGSE